MALANINVSSGGGKKTPMLVSAPVQSGTLTYDGSAQTPTWSGYDATQLTIGGTTSATDAGTYTVTFTLKSGYTWTDGTVSPKNVTWTIGKATVSVPTVTNTSFPYDNNSHAPTIGAYDSNFVAVTNNAQINAGNYVVTFTLKDTGNCRWSDGTTTAKTVPWTITTATATLSTSISDSSLVYDQIATISITANKSGGAISATSSNPAAVIIQSVTSSTVTIKCVGVSSNPTTITIVSAATTDYSSCTSTHSITTEKADGSITLSATDGTVTYGTPLTFTVTSNVSGGALSVTSSSNTYATASISGDAVTVNCVKYSATSRTITVTSAATANYKKATATFTATLARLFLAPPAVTNTSFTYDENSHAPTIGSYNSEYITVTNTAQTDAGSYDVVFALKDTTSCRWDDDTTKNKTVPWTIAKVIVATPIAEPTSFTYDGSSHAPVLSPNVNISTHDPPSTVNFFNFITVTNPPQTNVGNYVVTVALKDPSNCQWSDGTTAAITIPWTIAKATLNLSASTLGTIAPNSTGTIAVSGNASGGALSATSSDTSVATVTVSGDAVTVRGVSTGTATITITAAATTNYEAGTATCNVTVLLRGLITDSWSTISTRSKNGTAANYYKVGDFKEITLNGKIGDCLTLDNEKLYVFILHINYPMNGTADNNIIWGGFKTADGKDVALCDSKSGNSSKNGTICFNMNHRGQSSSSNGYFGTNYGGWKGSDFRYDILGATSAAPSEYNQLKSTSNVGYNATAATLTSPKANTLLAALPSDFRNALRLWSRWVDAKGNSSNVEANIEETIDAVTLLTEFEVHGVRSHANDYEKNHQTQMDYYKNGNSKVRRKHANTSSAGWWWVASPYSNNFFNFCGVRTDGSANYTTADLAFGIAPAFKT